MATLTTKLATVSGIIALPGHVLTGVLADNQSAGALWLQIHDKASAPGAGEAPRMSIRVGAGAQVLVPVLRQARGGLAFAAGVAFGWSSTRDTYTAHGTAADVSASFITEAA